MLTDDRVRDLLGLEADADVEAELRRLRASTSAPEQPAEETTTETTTTTTTTTPASEPAEQEDREPELVTLSAATWAQVQADAAAGREAAEALAVQRRNDTLAQAVREGRIAPNEQPAWLGALQRDEQGTVALLGALAPRFGTVELGADTAPYSEGADDESYNGFVGSMFPDLAS